MAQEERKCGGGSCGRGGAGDSGGGEGEGSWCKTRSYKKQKQKKPPQRGLGVAELERLRLEEQQKIDAAPFHPWHDAMNPFRSLALQQSIRMDTESNLSSSFPRNVSSVRNMDVAASGPVQWQSTRDYSNHEAKMRSRVMDHESELRSRMNLPSDSNLAMGGQGPMHRVGSDLPPLPASMQSHHLEPPSNQSHHHGSVAPFWPQADEVPGGGAKRSYPFSLENPPAPYFQFKIHKVGSPIMNRPEEPSFGEIDNLREGPSRSSSMMDSSSTDSPKENKALGGKHLALAPPPVDTPPWGQHFASGASRSYYPYPGFEFPQHQGYPEGFVYMHRPGWTYQVPHQRQFRQPYINFLPPPPPPDNVESTDSNGDSKDIDLNLKL